MDSILETISCCSSPEHVFLVCLNLPGLIFAWALPAGHVQGLVVTAADRLELSRFMGGPARTQGPRTLALEQVRGAQFYGVSARELQHPQSILRAQITVQHSEIVCKYLAPNRGALSVQEKRSVS